ncbi:MAG: TRAP transporter small permease subunit [Rhizobiaceae bacterium]|nr:TRAP transporter small permease subunit [Rhizobiaceae bacterium]|tara:strand:- start:44395 stop:44895 length:501 start_codon:yes stop_codon:yes gene_type:complete
MALIRLNDRLTKLLMILGATWAFVLCFIALADIIFRAINMPLHGTKEIVANSVVMIVFLQVGFAVRSRSMLSADFLIHMFGPRTRHALAAAGFLLGAAFFAILFHGAIDPALRSFANGEFDGEGSLRVPVWPTRFTILIGSALAVANYLLLAAIEALGLDVEDLQL